MFCYFNTIFSYLAAYLEFLADTEIYFILKISIFEKNIQNPLILKHHLEFQLKADIVSFLVHVILR